MPNELKPCPFCGGKGALEPHFYEGYDEEDNLVELVDYFAHCTKCGVSTPFLSCEEAAQDAWEERYITPSADGYTSSVSTSATPSPTGEGECEMMGSVSNKYIEREALIKDILAIRLYMMPGRQGAKPTMLAEEAVKFYRNEVVERIKNASAISMCCCDRCAHLERVNGRIVDYRCRVTGISFLKYAVDKAMISPSTFFCSEGTPKGGYGK